MYRRRGQGRRGGPNRAAEAGEGTELWEGRTLIPEELIVLGIGARQPLAARYRRLLISHRAPNRNAADTSGECELYWERDWTASDGM